MKKLGLIGGTGPESTVPYYRGIVYGVQKRSGKAFFPNLTIESLSAFEVLRLCGEKDYKALADYLVKGVDCLAAAGAQFAALTGNTPHIVFEELSQRSSIPVVSMVETTCAETKKQGFSKIGLLGTSFTMREAFFKAPFMKAGIEIVTPTESEIDFIGGKIEAELELGLVKEETRAAFLRVVDRMANENGIEALVLGCTELPLLFDGVSLPVACLDTMRIHIETLIGKIMED